VFYAKPDRPILVRAAAVRLSPVFYSGCGIDAGLGNRPARRNIHFDSRGDASFLAGCRSRQALRVGEGDECCVEGGPQDTWGMFSFPLYERLKAETPEFEEVTAFQAGRWRLSVRRQGVESAARPLRSNTYRALILNPWSFALSAAGVYARRRQAGRSTCSRAQPPCLADRLRSDLPWWVQRSSPRAIL